MLEGLYHYKATVLRVVDGDTVDAEVDLGLDVRHRLRLRLYGIDTPELNSPDPAERVRAAAARDCLAAMVEGQEVVVRTIKDRREKYGRYLATLHILPINGEREYLDVNRRLIDLGYAVAAPAGWM